MRKVDLRKGSSLQSLNSFSSQTTGKKGNKPLSLGKPSFPLWWLGWKNHLLPEVVSLNQDVLGAPDEVMQDVKK